MTISAPAITVKALTMAYGSFVLQRDLNFTIAQGDIFVIMGGNGCGKSTLLRHMLGLKPPASGSIWYGEENFWELPDDGQARILRKTGILYQTGALWSSMTLAENIALPLLHYTDLPPAIIRELVSFKLSLVGLAGFEEFYPAELSGGMRKRASLARAIALDPDFLFFDEPSAGLDPISARILDELILELRESLGATLIIVTHELASIYAIATNSVFLDANSKTMLATGNPKTLLRECTNATVVNFLTRGTGNREVRTV
ncbi:MAG: ATP-binding cassette domain-containing protein [Desulfobulbaceae bacterium]|jgi:phospholipid/cholesterol/gamma-HCH transport system ATP-binding protein|nr:ATP-binding cassette domain-containing protein [Desulfobulbaceae bacterium]